MLKISSILGLSATAFMLSACGGSGSDTSFSSFSSKKTFGQVTYVCTTRAAADACQSISSCGAQSACRTDDVIDNTPAAACSVSGNNVIVPNNSRCSFSQAGVNNGSPVTYSCTNGIVSNGFITSPQITLGSIVYRCSTQITS